MTQKGIIMRKKELEELLAESERSKKEMFTHLFNKNASLRKELKEAKKGASQINAALNSILIGAALDHDNVIKVPKNHFTLLDLWDYEVADNGEEYVFTVTPKRAQDDLPFEEGRRDE